MELFKLVKQRSFLSEAAYVAFNIALPIAVLGLILSTSVPWPAVGLVLLSKWRIFAVRSRYWIANIRANTVDLIVGISTVVYLYAASGDIVTQIALTTMYITWLVFIKPKSKQRFMTAQAAIGLVYGIGAIVQISPTLSASIVVLLAWIVGYATARHVLSGRHETHINVLSLIWGFVVAEIMWLSYHWTIGYQVGESLQLSQMVIVISALSFLAERAYTSFHKHGTVQIADVTLPGLLTVSIVGVTVFFFGGAVAI